LSLADAFRFAEAIYEQGGGEASYDMASRLLGNSASSSSFVKKTNAAKLYGLITEQNDTFRLTPGGRAIAAPVSEANALSAKKAAFLKVPVFAKIFERHKGKLVPADEFLQNIIVQEANIPQELSAAWVTEFHQAARAASLIYARPDGKLQLMESGSPQSAPQQPQEAAPETAQSSPRIINIEQLPLASQASSITATTAAPLTASGQMARFVLSDGRFAEFNIPFGITARDAKRLKNYLKGLELMLDSAISDGEENLSGVRQDGTS
jgi:hypothetical protein